MEFLNNYKIELLNEIGITPLWKWNNPYNEKNIYSIFQNTHKNSPQISNKISNKISPQNSKENINPKKIVENIFKTNAKNNTNENVENLKNTNNVEKNILTIENNHNFSWETLCNNIQQCKNCQLHTTHTNYVVGIGNKNADWLFVGEAPGELEDKIGEPFVGDSGKLLDNMLQNLQLSRNYNIYIANTVKCRPPLNRNPNQEELNKCRQFLLQQIQLIQPKIIICLGKVAFYSLFQTQLKLPENLKITEYRKKMLLFNYNYANQIYEIPTFVTYHPSYLLRTPMQKIESWKDLCMAKRYYDTHLT